MPVSGTSFVPTSSFKRDIPVVASVVEKSIQFTGYPHLSSEMVATKIAEYMSTNQNPFGAAEWKQYFGVDVGPETPFEEGFDEWWNGPDPVDVYNRVPKPRLVSETHLRPVFAPRFFTETHLRPVFAPRFFTDIQEKTLHARSLQTLSHLGLEFFYNSEALEQNRNKKAGPSCWLVMRKGVLEDTRNQSWEVQQEYLKKLNAVTGAGYEEKPSIIDLATVILPCKRADGERHLGDNTGVEGRFTYSRGRETVKYQDKEYPLVLGGSAPSGVRVFCFVYDAGSLGVAALRKF